MDRTDGINKPAVPLISFDLDIGCSSFHLVRIDGSDNVR